MDTELENKSERQNCELESYFTADAAQKLFLKHCGYHFHTTVPGQILARMSATKLGYAEDGRAAYDARYWSKLWKGMFALALNRHGYGQGPHPLCCEMPIPPLEFGPLRPKRIYVDYANQKGC